MMNNSEVLNQLQNITKSMNDVQNTVQGLLVRNEKRIELENRYHDLNEKQLKITKIVHQKEHEFIVNYAQEQIKNIDKIAIIMEYFKYVPDTVTKVFQDLTDTLIISKIKAYYINNELEYNKINQLSTQSIRNIGHKYTILTSLNDLSNFERDLLYHQIKNNFFDYDHLTRLIQLIGFQEDAQEIFYMSKRCTEIFTAKYCIPALINKEYAIKYIAFLQSIENLL